MSTFTLEMLRGVMADAGGGAVQVAAPAEFADVPFDQLGFDSLAVLDIQSRITDQFAVRVPDDALTGATTPAQVVALVNELLGQRR